MDPRWRILNDKHDSLRLRRLGRKGEGGGECVYFYGRGGKGAGYFVGIHIVQTQSVISNLAAAVRLNRRSGREAAAEINGVRRSVSPARHPNNCTSQRPQPAVNPT